MPFNQLASVMTNKNDSDTRRLAEQFELKVLTLKKFMADRYITDNSEAVTKIVDRMSASTLQCQSNFRSEPNKIRYICNAVLAQP